MINDDTIFAGVDSYYDDSSSFSSKYKHHTDDGITFDCDSLTQQHFAADADINNIIDRYTRTGILPVPTADAIFGDFGDFDYHAAMNNVAVATEYFDSLPSSVRREFDNSVGVFLERIHDPSFAQRATELGLLKGSEAESGGHPLQKQPAQAAAVSPSLANTDEAQPTTSPSA